MEFDKTYTIEEALKHCPDLAKECTAITITEQKNFSKGKL